MRHHEADVTPGDRTYAMWTHVGPLIAFGLTVVTSGVSFFVPALVALCLWLARRHDSVFLDDHGREALNFQISLVLLGVVAAVVGLLLCGVGILVTVPAVAVLGVVGGIMGATAAHRGEYFRYPACIRFL